MVCRSCSKRVSDSSKLTNHRTAATFSTFAADRGNISYESYLNGNYTDSMFIEPVTEYELQMEINNLNENKSTGHDEISAKMIKTIGKKIVKPLTYIFLFVLPNWKNTKI